MRFQDQEIQGFQEIWVCVSDRKSTEYSVVYEIFDLKSTEFYPLYQNFYGILRSFETLNKIWNF